ncbi:cyanophycin synthetase [Lampropedia hyalina DSM 16112]|jgi:cyanophycin synthetase|uniref:Cyanophycin synthetase n=1 Tax=Lampropedia hyalina DSM 16112 TaxID=1122156 RepID=A0A1M5AXW0_9BURK|nr:cyanophycin synthetase [Lampropedia hyalina]SHF34917.1 cyanophycin synthetase [Lampropedia hyalina DSM 16112]
MRTFDDIALLKVRYLRGPSIWTYREVLEVWLDLGELEAFPSHTIAGFPERLKSWLPGLIEHHCGVGERGGFLMRLDEGTWCGHILEHIIIELLNLAGMPTAFGQTRSTSREGVYRMVFRAKDEQVARTALAQGHRLIMAAINDQPFEVAPAVAAIREVIEERYLGPSTAAIVDAAFERRIPFIRLNDGNLVQLGYGAAQKRIWTAETADTSAIAEGIAHDKDLTKSLIQICGVPVPEWQVADSPEQAWEAAQDIGLPVVVKPSDASRNRGVFVNLHTEAEVRAAWAGAEPHGYEVMVERMVPGNEHRLLVVDGKVVAAARSDSLHVTGNGQSSIAQLVESQLNSDPRRRSAADTEDTQADEAGQGLLPRVAIEHSSVQAELVRQGFTPQSVPAAGKLVMVQRSSTQVTDCTDDVHPETAHAAALAAKVVGLDIAGVDVMAQDIGQPLEPQGGAIIEVNAGPGLLMHLQPTVGAPQPVGQAIVEYLFPTPSAQEGNGDTVGRIPIIGIAGERHGSGIARLVAWLLHLAGRKTGVACQQGIFLDRRLVDKRPSAHWEAGNRLLMNQQIQVAVIENGAASILRDGLAYDRCHIGLVTDMDGFETLAEFDIQERAQMTRVLRTQVDVVLGSGLAILNADDAQVADLAKLSDGGVVCYTTDASLYARTRAQAPDPTADGDRTDASAPATARWVVAEGDSVQLYQPDGSAETLDDWPSLCQHAHTAFGLDASALLASVATGWAMDVAPELIVAGIRTFEPRLPAHAMMTR